MPIDTSETTTSKPLTADEKFNSLISQVDDLYQNSLQNKAKVIKAKLTEKYHQFTDPKNSKSAEEITKFVNLVEDVFSERKKFTEYKKNVLRQETEVYQANLRPEKASFKDYAKQSVLVDNLSIEDIQKYQKPIEHITIPAVQYRSNLMKAGAKTQDLVEMNSLRLFSVIEKGEDLSDENKEKLSSLRSNNVIHQQRIAKAANVFHSVFDAAGRGIYSSGQAVDHSYNKEYSAKKEKIISDLAAKIDVNNSKYATLLRQIESQLSLSKDSLDVLSLSQIQDEIKKSIEEINKEHKAAVDKTEKDLKDAHENMLKDLQNTVDSSDNLMPMRLLSIGLMFTPFGVLGPISILSEYIGTAVDIFGPFFEAGKSIGEGFGDAITSKHFGVLGELMDVMEVDLAIETIIDETPIIKDVTEILNALTDNSTAQYFFDEISPLQNSALVYLAVAGVVSLGQAPAEITHFKNKSDNKIKHDKISEKIPAELEKDITAKGEISLKKAIDNNFQKRKDKYQELETLNYFADNLEKSATDENLKQTLKKLSPEIYQLFEDDKFSKTDKSGKKSFSKEEMIKFIAKNEDEEKKPEEVAIYMQKAVVNFKTFIAAKRNEAEFDRLSNPENQKELAEEIKKIDAEIQKRFLKFETDRLGIIAQINDENISKIEAQIKERLFIGAQTRINLIDTPKPKSYPKVIEANEFNGFQVFPPLPPTAANHITSETARR